MAAGRVPGHVAGTFVEQVFCHQPIGGSDVRCIERGDLIATEGAVPDANRSQPALEVAAEIPRTHAQRRRTVLRGNAQVPVLLATAIAGPAVLVALAENAVLVDRRPLGICHADHVNPLSRCDLVLEVAADAESAFGVEQVKADPIGAVLGVIGAVHAKHPFLLSTLAFAEPVDIA